MIAVNTKTTINKSILCHELKQILLNLEYHNMKTGDEYYLKPTVNQLWKFVQEVKANHLIHSHFVGGETSDSFDCNAFALYFHSQCREKMRTGKHPWAFGELWMETSTKVNHGYCLCFTLDDGFYLIWPQLKKIKKFKKKFK